MQFTEVEKITVLLTRARERERKVIGQIAQNLNGNKQKLTALKKRLQERQADVMLLEEGFR
jgi:hypothetical protein